MFSNKSYRQKKIEKKMETDGFMGGTQQLTGIVSAPLFALPPSGQESLHE